jgi:hypothetical protein
VFILGRPLDGLFYSLLQEGNTMNTILNDKQKHRKDLILKGINGLMTNKQLSLELFLTIRRITEIKRGYRRYGDAAFVHGNTGRIPANKVPESVVRKIIDIRETTAEGEKIFDKANFTHFRDILEEYNGIKISKSTVRKILKNHGYSSPKLRRIKKQKKLHPMRLRKQHMGELVQADGSPYNWLGDGKLYCIQGFIDDATGIPLGLYMTRHECLLGYLEATKQMFRNYGIPEQLYPDRASVFFTNNKVCREKQEKQHLTQFGRIMEEYGVDMFPAYSPQAKGRIERFWETIQSRLVIEFKIRGIKTIEAANDFLPQFMNMFAKRFGVNPVSEENRFVPLTSTDLQKMNTLLVAKEERVLDGAGVFSLLGYKFYMKGCGKQRIAVVMSIQDGIYALDKNGKRHELVLLEEDSENPHMPKVLKELIAEYFMKDTKAKYRGAYQKAG